MAGLRIINIKTGKDSAVNGGGSGGGQIPANVVTRDDIFDSNGKIRADVIDVSIDGQSLSLKEDSSNKVTTIDSSSTHTQYPSAKAVYDVLSSAIGAIDVSIDPASLEGKEDNSNKVTVIDSSSTDEQYPSAKAVYDVITSAIGAIDVSIDPASLEGKEDSSNKVTVIDSSSTDEQYPSAKSVYDALSQIEGGGDSNLVFIKESEYDELKRDDEIEEGTLYIVKKSVPTFGGLRVSPTYACYDNSNKKYIIKDDWLEEKSDLNDIARYFPTIYGSNSIDAANEGRIFSYYLNSEEVVNEKIEYNGSKEWRTMSRADFLKLFYDRNGSELIYDDGSVENARYAFVKFEYEDVSGLYFNPLYGILLFPDDRKISCQKEFLVNAFGESEEIIQGGNEFNGQVQAPEGVKFINECEVSEINNLIEQGCVFVGCYSYLIRKVYKPTYVVSYNIPEFDAAYILLDDRLIRVFISNYASYYDYASLSSYYSSYNYDNLGDYYTTRFVTDDVKESYDFYNGDKKILSTDKVDDSKTIYLTRSEYNRLIEDDKVDPDKFYVVEDKGDSFGGLVIAPTQLVYDGNKFYIPEFGEDVDTGSGEEIPPIEIEPPLASSGSTSLYDYACINSAGSKYGKTAGSTYFAPRTDLINELVNPNAQTADGFFIPISSLGYDDWKIMTGDDFRKIFDPESRPGATVNGNESCLYAFVYASEGGVVEPLSASVPNAGNDEDRFGVLIFPDGVNIEGATLDNFNYNENNVDNSGAAYAVNGNAKFATWISPEDINDYISQGCVFIPMLGSYSADNEIPWDDGWAPILTFNGIYHFNEYGFNINGTSSDAWEEYIPIRLVSKKAAEGATTYTVYKNGGVVIDTNDRKELKNKVNYVEMTQQEFVNLKNKDPKTLYVVTGATAEETVIGGESMPSFGGVAIAPTQLFYDGKNFHIGAPVPETIDPGDIRVVNNDSDGYFGWDLNSYDSMYGLEPGSTYFSYDELVKTFDSEGDPEVPIDNGGLKLSYNGFNDWRMMTYEDVQKLFNTELREGSTVNGTPNVLYAVVKVNDTDDQESSFRGGDNIGIGVLLFPDGMTINGVSVDNATNVFPINDDICNISDSTTYWETYINGGVNGIAELTTDEINEYTSQGCVFLPSLGAYEERTTSDYGNWWGNEDEYNSCDVCYYYTGHLDSSAESHVADNINPTRKWFDVRINENESSPLVSFAFCDSSTYSEYGEQDHNVYIPVRLVSTSAAQSGSKSVPKTSVYLGDILITGESVTESGFVFVTRAEYEALGSNINPNKFYVVEDGASGGDTTAKFGDIEVAPTQLMWSEDRGGFFIPTLNEALEIANSGGGSAPSMDAEPTPEDLELWNNLYMYSVINSNGDYVGREDRSTYFSYNELGQFFSSAGDSFDGESDIDNKGGKVTFNGKSWRLPTKEEMRALFDSTKRTGATVDGIANACWAPAYISSTSGDDEPVVESDMFNENDYLAIVVFPDDVEIDAASMNIKFNKINPTEEESRYEPQPKGHEVYTELNSIQLGYLLSKGCLILPMLGFYLENSGDGGIMNAEDVPDGWWASILEGKGLYMTATKDYCYYINGSTDIYDDDAYAYFENTTPIWGTVRLVAEAAGNQSYKVYKNGQLIFDSNNTSGSNESVAEIKNELKNKVDGEILTPEEYEGLIESGEINSDKIYFVGYKAMPSFGGVAIAPAQYVHYMNIGGTYHIGRDDESEYNYSTYGYQYNNSRNTTYFSFSSLTQVFDYRAENIIDSSNQITRPLDNKITSYNSSKIESVYNNYGDWRLPTKDDLERIFGDERHGSYIKCGSDEAQNVQYAPVWIQFGEYDVYFYDNGNPLFAYILFPDDVMIDASNDILERTFGYRTLMRSDVEFWLSNGCVILPALGFYENYNTASSFGEVGLYMFTGDVNGNVAFMISDASSGLCYIDPSSVLGTVRLVSERAAVGEFKIYKGVTPLFSYNDIESSIDDKINGDFLDFEDFSLKGECGELDSNSIYIVSEQTGDLPSFGGISLSQGPLYVDSNGNFAIDTDNPFRNSFGTLKGTVEDSTFFRVIDLMPYFNTDSGTLYDKCIDNGNNRVSAYGYNDWRVPTYEDFNDKIFSSSRNGSIVNGFYNCRWAVVSIENDCRAALVVFPDDRIIRIDGIDNISNTMNMLLISSIGVSLSNICTITMNQAKLFISQGCVILPVYGNYDFSRSNSWCTTYDGQAANGLYMTGSVSGGVGNIMALSLYTDNNVFRPRLSSYSGTYSTSAYGMVHLVSDDACRKNINIYKGRELVLGNKIDEIKPSSTVDELPSAKAVYRYVNEKLRDIENLLSQI